MTKNIEQDLKIFEESLKRLLSIIVSENEFTGDADAEIGLFNVQRQIEEKKQKSGKEIANRYERIYNKYLVKYCEISNERVNEKSEIKKIGNEVRVEQSTGDISDFDKIIKCPRSIISANGRRGEYSTIADD